jgi:two-component system response regulator HydG
MTGSDDELVLGGRFKSTRRRRRRSTEPLEPAIGATEPKRGTITVDLKKKDAETISIAGATFSVEDRTPAESLALVIAWCADEPARLGEVALFGQRGAAQTLGRGEGEDGEPRVRFFRQRPSRLSPTEPLSGLPLSRRQLTVKPSGASLAVERVGRCALLVNGVPTEKALVSSGDTILLRGQLLLFCTRRVPSIPKTVYFLDRSFGAFGEPDGVGILGEAPGMWQMRERIAFAANAGKHVLLHGESGTGKELAARAVHGLSGRAGKPFVARNAATLPSGLIDAELFGNAKNYPNPGMAERAGLIGEADGGTLFLDEIAEIPAEQQAHLLRVLDSDGEYQRLGEATSRRSDFILVGATNRDVRALKHDVAARLTLRLELPPLDARREDIPLLVRHLLLLAAKKGPLIGERFLHEGADGRLDARVDPELIEDLLGRDYETHMRELDALLWRAMAASPGDTVLYTDDLRQESRGRDAEPSADQLRAALKSAGSVQSAARALGLKSRYALYRLMKKHGIEADGE